MLTWAIGLKQESPRWVVWRRAHVRLVAPLTIVCECATAPAAPIPLSALRRVTLEFTFVTISSICVFAFFVAYQAAAACSRRTIVVGAPATSLTTLKLNLMRANGALNPTL